MVSAKDSNKTKQAVDNELKSSFPSDEFLQKYFTDDELFTSPPAYGSRTQSLYSMIRELFFLALVYAPYKHIREQDKANTGITSQFVFVERRLSDQAKLMLFDSVDYTPSTSTVEVFEHQLFAEMEAQFKLGNLPNVDSWWEWFVIEGTIGIRLTPEANSVGGNRPVRSLSEMFGDSKGS